MCTCVDPIITISSPPPPLPPNPFTPQPPTTTPQPPPPPISPPARHPHPGADGGKRHGRGGGEHGGVGPLCLRPGHAVCAGKSEIGNRSVGKEKEVVKKGQGGVLWGGGSWGERYLQSIDQIGRLVMYAINPPTRHVEAHPAHTHIQQRHATPHTGGVRGRLPLLHEGQARGRRAGGLEDDRGGGGAGQAGSGRQGLMMI